MANEVIACEEAAVLATGGGQTTKSQQQAEDDLESATVASASASASANANANANANAGAGANANAGAGAGAGASVPLIRVAWARSGDKGDVSNIGVIARTPALLPYLRQQLTAEAAVAYLAHPVQGKVTRYDVTGIRALNFVCEQALDGGGMASMRNDALGTGMAQTLLPMPMPMPVQMPADLIPNS
jgi:hypothetical protein